MTDTDQRTDTRRKQDDKQEDKQEQKKPRARQDSGDSGENQEDMEHAMRRQEEVHKDREGERKQAVEAWRQIQSDSDDGPDTTATLAPLLNADPQDWLGSNQDPDVLLAVPNLGIDRIALNVKNLRAHVRLQAKVLDLLHLDVGADVSVDEIDLEIDNVRVQAILKVKLEEVVKIVDRVMQTIDANPEILTNLTEGLGKGLEGGLGQDSSVAKKEIDEDRQEKEIDSGKSDGKRPHHHSQS